MSPLQPVPRPRASRAEAWIGANILGFVMFTAVIAVSGCLARRDAEAMDSAFTTLAPAACTAGVDKNSPNETPFRVCRGIGGYDLKVRPVESGRVSIDVVDASRREYALQFQNVVTHSMCSLGDQAEWRVTKRDDEAIPKALIVQVQAREDGDDPTKITNTYLAISKITAEGACVTDKVAQGTKSTAEVHKLADSAWTRPCAPELSQMDSGPRQP